MIRRNSTVRVKKLTELTDSNIPEVFIRNRKRNKIGLVDSPIYLTLNSLWLVKHDTSGVLNGISVGKYGVYHEDELETIALPVIQKIEPRKSTNDFIVFNDEEFTYNDWDDVPD